MPRRPRQPYLSDEMNPPSHPDIDRAAEAYVDARDARMEMLKTEVERHDALLQAMKNHGLTEYKFDAWEVKLEAENKTRVKVKRQKSQEDEE